MRQIYLGRVQLRLLRAMMEFPLVETSEKKAGGGLKRSAAYVGKTQRLAAQRAVESLIQHKLAKEILDSLGRRIFKITNRGKGLLATIERFRMGEKKVRIPIKDILLFRKVDKHGEFEVPFESFLSVQGKRFMEKYGDFMALKLEKKPEMLGEDYFCENCRTGYNKEWVMSQKVKTLFDMGFNFRNLLKSCDVQMIGCANCKEEKK